MSKLDIGVGDEFPLDESRDGRGRHRGHRHHHRHHHHHGHTHHRRHRGGRGFGRLAFLLVAAGLAALVVNHQLTQTMAFGLVGAGFALLLLGIVARGIFHWRFHRRAVS